jgi:hypothetical protein
MICENCGREVFGFWKRSTNKACSKKCLRSLIFSGKVTKIPPYAEFPELGILPPHKSGTLKIK